MPRKSTRVYEGLFLISNELANKNLDGLLETIRTALTKYEAKILSLYKWDERKLAYEIKGQKRGTYILSYFTIDPLNIQELTRDLNLSEDLLRFMFVLDAEEINAKHTEERPPSKDGLVEEANQARQKAKAEKRLAAASAAGNAEAAPAAEKAPE